MATPTDCDLCGMTMQRGTNRVGGANVCDVCLASDITDLLARRGFALQTKRWVSKATRSEDSDRHYCRVTGSAPIKADMTATFSREQGSAILGWLLGRKGSNDLQVGDSLFDDAIRIDTGTEDGARALLAHQGLQAIIMDAVDEFGDIAFVQTVDGMRVTVTSCWSEGSSLPESTRQHCTIGVALHQLEAASRDG